MEVAILGRIRKVRIIESILLDDFGQEINILRELFRMMDFPFEPITIDGKTSRQEFVESSFRGDERYVHLSTHGDVNGFYIHGERRTHVGIKHFEEYLGRDASGTKKILDGRFLTVSSCGDPRLSFWKDFHTCTNVSAVVAPMGEVEFDESAMFCTLFYFALLRHPNNSKRQPASQHIIDFVDTFQRTKGAYLSLGGCGAYRLCFWWKGEFKEII